MDYRILLHTMKKLIVVLILTISLISCENLFFEETSAGEVQVFDSFFKEVERHYSFFNVISFETFEKEYRDQRTILAQTPSRGQLNASLQILVNHLRDGHTDVYGFNTISYNDWFDQFPANHLDDIRSYFSSYRTINSALEYGRLENQNIGYLRINTFSGGVDFSSIDNIIDELSDTDAMIIDVRSNGGGDSRNADLIISRFNDQSRLQFLQRRRTGGLNDFGAWFENITETTDKLTFNKPTFVLTNRKCLSSTEWFVSGMMTIPNVQIVCDTTGGGSGNPLLKELPNGWSMRTSNTQKQLPNGRDFQFTGLYPDIPIWINESDSIEGVDTILEKAIELANN